VGKDHDPSIREIKRFVSIYSGWISAPLTFLLRRRHLHLDPPTLNSIIEQEPHQASHTHVPLGCTGGDEENKEVLFAKSDVPDDQGKLDPGKKEDDAQNGTGKNLKE
jgi:hypothetical protein